MKTRTFLRLAPGLLLAAGLLAGCESTDSGSSSVHGSFYYGVGFYDTWYDSPVYYPPDVIVTPPDRPDSRPHPEHPIAKPPEVSRPTTRPTPSIPSMPRSMGRVGGGRR